MTTRIPLVSYLVLDGDAVHLVGQECLRCGTIFLGRRNGCGCCAHRSFKDRRLRDTGRIRSFTIVHRAPTPTPTPFVAVVVDHDGGGTAKANLIGVEPVPDAVHVGAAVRVVGRPAGTDAAGTIAITFAYELS